MSRRGPAAAAAPEPVQLAASAIWVRSGPAPVMPAAHRHDDLEVNLVVSGRLEYLFGGQPLHVSAGQIALFWAATPHRLVERDGAGAADCRWVHVPLETVLGWGLPDEHLADLIGGRPVVVAAAAAGRDVEPMFASWTSDLGDEGGREAALLEIQALVRRLLPRGGRKDGDEPAPVSADRAMHHVVAMARYATAHFRSDISAADIARASHLHPNYAMTLFRETLGTTLGGYLSGCRVAEAQRLLLTTNMTTTEIADAAGFGSQSSFYAHFTRTAGTSPTAYRRRAAR